VSSLDRGVLRMRPDETDARVKKLRVAPRGIRARDVAMTRLEPALGGELLSRCALDDILHDRYLLKSEAGTGVPGFFIGETAENVFQHVDCSLLAVRPRAS